MTKDERKLKAIEVQKMTGLTYEQVRKIFKGKGKAQNRYLIKDVLNYLDAQRNKYTNLYNYAVAYSQLEDSLISK